MHNNCVELQKSATMKFLRQRTRPTQERAPWNTLQTAQMQPRTNELRNYFEEKYELRRKVQHFLESGAGSLTSGGRVSQEGAGVDHCYIAK